MTAPPSADEQLAFLAKIQRLLSEGDFVSTYKYALLMALTDVAVERGQDDGSVLDITTRQLAERFVQLYWQQAAPYRATEVSGNGSVLFQNGGSQAAVVSAIAEFRAQFSASTVISAQQELTGYQALISKVTTTVAAQPLKYLQNLGGTTEVFLYERTRGGVMLLPGVAHCLRRFQPLINQLARAQWVLHIKRNRLNSPVLGQVDDLEEFLFETPRQALQKVAEGLQKLSGCKCFYCQEKLNSADVDHFVPFSLYPKDWMDNFVLAHPSCNRSKSDRLAARRHLENWVDRCHQQGADLEQIGYEAGFSSSTSTSLAVARWGYQAASTARGQAWVQAGQFELVGPEYLEVFG